MKEQLSSRIAEIEKAIQDSIINHNGLLARLDEANVLLKMAEDCCAKEVVEDGVICAQEVVAE